MTLLAESSPPARSERGELDADVGALPTAVDPMALSLNENPYPPLPAVCAALSASIQAVNRYPEFLPERLRNLIARRIGVPDAQVVVGSGATGVMLQTLHAVTNPGDRMVIPDLTFEGYPIVAGMVRVSPVVVPLDNRGYHDLNAMADAASTARVVAICRPHNPTGTVESAVDIERFLRRIPDDTVVLLDEAYTEFVSPAHRLDSVGLVNRFPNVVVLRTFSKAYGLAGLRIGYAYASAQLAERLWAMQLPFGTSTTSLVAVAASYQAEAELRQRVRMITSERRSLQARLRALEIHTTETHANYVYLPAAERPWTEVFDRAGPRVKHYRGGGVRITIGDGSSTGAVMAALYKKF